MLTNCCLISCCKKNENRFLTCSIYDNLMFIIFFNNKIINAYGRLLKKKKAAMG